LDLLWRELGPCTDEELAIELAARNLPSQRRATVSFWFLAWPATVDLGGGKELRSIPRRSIFIIMEMSLFVMPWTFSAMKRFWKR